MKVCILTTSFPRTVDDEAGIFVLRLVEALSGRGIHGVVVVPRDDNETLHQVGLFSVIRFSYTLFTRRSLAFGAGIIPNLRSRPWAVLQVPGILLGYFWMLIQRRGDCRLVHTQWLITALPAWISALFTGRRFVVTARGEDLRILSSRLVRIVLGRALARAYAVIAVSESAKSELIRVLPRLSGKVRVIENGVSIYTAEEEEMNRIRAKVGVSYNQIVLSFIGSVIPRKRIEMLISLLPHSIHTEALLVLCGRTEDQDYLSYCKGLAESLGVSQRVRFVGVLTPREVSTLLRVTDLYVSASEFEGRPNSMVEALAHRVAVVASDIPAHRELAEKSHGVELFSSAEEGARIVDDLLGTKSRMAEMGRRGEAFASTLSWDVAAAKYEALYREATLNPNTTAKILPKT